MSLTFDVVRQQLMETFQDEFARAHPSYPIAWENQAFTQPKGPWVDFKIMEGPSVRVDVGTRNKRFRHYGVVNVQLMVPENTGTKTLNLMTDTVFNILADRVWLLSDPGKLWTGKLDKRSRPNINGYACRAIMADFTHDAPMARTVEYD